MEGYKVGFVNNRKVLIKLLILDDALTNKDRNTIIDPIHARYRCNRALVIEIIDMYNNTYRSAISYYSKNKLIYNINEFVTSDYDEDVRIESGKGIHYFINKDTAINYKVPILYQHWSDENNTYKEYYGNGQLRKKIKFNVDINNVIMYKNIQEYFINGQIKKEYNLAINKYDGLYTEWYSNGLLKKNLTYNKNKLII